MINSIWFKISWAIIVIISFILLNILVHRKILQKTLKKEWRAEQLEKEEAKIKEILNRDLKDLDSNKLKSFLIKIKDIGVSYQTLKEFSSEIDKKTSEAEKLFENKIEKEEMERKHFEKRRIESEIEELKKERYVEELKQKCNDDIILDKLEPNKNWIYEFEKLNPKEIGVLEKVEFTKITEYDPICKKNKTFLVKQILNHSLTHTFLVERIKQLISQHVDSKRIHLHETRDADITFEIGRTICAFEIETGTLLSKKNQRKEKVSYLNNKYGKNWWFVVSHRDLAKKYREFGRVTSRVGVCKILEKIVKK